MGFDLNTANNSYCFSPQHLIKDQDYETLCLYLIWLPINHIKRTLATTTDILSHIALLSMSLIIVVATDTMFSNEPVLGSNTTVVQIFIGIILSTLMYMELLLIVISLVH